MNLKELYEKYDIKKNKIFNSISNKKNQGGDCILLGYDKIYDKYLHNYRNRIKPIRLAEIGILQGYSLYIYSKYFENIKLYGYDINTDIFFDHQTEEEFLSKVIEIKKINSLKECETNTINTRFDIIIDDGCHKPISMMTTFKNFFNKLRKNGIYFIEDVTEKKYHKYLKLFLERNNIIYTYEKNHITHGILIIPYQILNNTRIIINF